MSTVSTIHEAPTDDLLRHIDQRVTVRGLGWADYERLLTVRGERARPRMTYLKGDLELMSPSWDHEWKKKGLARMVEAYAEERGLDLNGIGSWTIRSEPDERGLEPDECYILGERGSKNRPDLAIEVDWTTGGMDKLEVYRGLGVPEVWIWRRGRIEVYLLRGASYQRAPASALLSDLDLEVVARHLESESQSTAVRAFRNWVRQQDPG